MRGKVKLENMKYPMPLQAAGHGSPCCIQAHRIAPKDIYVQIGVMEQGKVRTRTQKAILRESGGYACGNREKAVSIVK
jgi:hypothetical protein